MIPAFFMLCIALWTALLYFFFNPWAAGSWLLFCIALGPILYSELREVEIDQPEPADLVDFDAELKCKGRLPRDKDFDGVEKRRAA